MTSAACGATCRGRDVRAVVAVNTLRGAARCCPRPVRPAENIRVSKPLYLRFRRQWSPEVGVFWVPSQMDSFVCSAASSWAPCCSFYLLIFLPFVSYLGLVLPHGEPRSPGPCLAPWCSFLGEPWLHLPPQGFMKSPSQMCSQRAGDGRRGAQLPA